MPHPEEMGAPEVEDFLTHLALILFYGTFTFLFYGTLFAFSMKTPKSVSLPLHRVREF